MSQIGTTINNTTSQVSQSPTWDTANAFFIGVADWGPVGPVSITSQPGVAAVVGPRSGSNTTLYDSLDVFFREGGQTAFVSRVVGASASAATLTLRDASTNPSLALAANYVGAYGNQIQVTVTNSGTSVVIALTDTYGNSLAVSPALTTQAAVVAWFATTGYVTAVQTGANLPATLAATALSGGTSNQTSVTLTQWQNALNLIPASLGPGQVLAPGATNLTVAGIWAALGAHALANNRVAICDLPDATSATTILSYVSTTFQTAATGPIGFWAGNLSAPGVIPGTTRSIPPSAVIAALCAQVDQTGNPNQAAAGQSFLLQYVTGPYSIVSGPAQVNPQTYSTADISTLNSAGVNAFANVFGSFQNYGFVSSIPSTVDVVYWQLSHARLRMALTASTQIVAQPFVFSQIDGQGSDILSFGSALGNMLKNYYQLGALYGTTPSQAYTVNVSGPVNPPAQLQQGILSAVISVRMSPFAQLIPVTITTVPITVNV